MSERGDDAIFWIEKYCIVPFAGKPVKLSMPEWDILHHVYEDETKPRSPSRFPLGAYLALLHTCGPPAASILWAGVGNTTLDGYRFPLRAVDWPTERWS
jgi:hypothetical protein